ncbi:MAG: NHL repeat-containing protein [Gallionellaceae bacterium]
MKRSTNLIPAGLLFALSCMLVACLGGGGGSTSIPVAPTPTLELFAGNMGGVGSNDGTVATAHFSNPSGVATDSAGNVYVADSGNNTIRKITPAGVVSTLAGTAGIQGSADGIGATASFNAPSGMATDSAGNVYVADSGNSTIRKIAPDGRVTTLAGNPGVYGNADGTGAAASFSYPTAVATDSAGNVYVADSGSYTIRKITQSGVVSTLAGTLGMTGSADGSGAAASFNNPSGIATDSAGNVYVADSWNNTIRKITQSGVVSTLAGVPGVTGGSADGTGVKASFSLPNGVATDSAGNVYVADTGNNAIRKITQSGVVSTLAGVAGVTGSADGTGVKASFSYPTGIATDSAGNVYVADKGNNAIRKITPAGEVSTLVGARVVGSSDGSGAAASFDYPTGIATDSAGNLYVVDYGNNTIRKITPAGVVSTLAGTPGIQGSADGTGVKASFAYPTGIATDSAGNVYVADFGNSTIRKIAPDGRVTTLAGNPGVYGNADGTGAAANFSYPSDVATDSVGNVYVADSLNRAIRKITPAGVVSTLVGSGTWAAAGCDYPGGIATDSAGNVYVVDYGNKSSPVGPPVPIQLESTIRKITPSGVVTTLAGTPGVIGSADGKGGAASFNYPGGIATDSAGNVYVADFGNNTIRKITPTGVVSTVVGVTGQFGFMPGALPGMLSMPRGVAISGTALYITTYNGVAVVRNVP